MADKGLKSNVVGLFGGTMLGISSVAPAYALTATLGILAASVGANTPVVIIAGFLPMFFAAYACQQDHARCRHLVHLDLQSLRSLHRLAGRMGSGARHDHRAVQYDAGRQNGTRRAAAAPALAASGWY